MKQLLNKLLCLPGVSGREGLVAQALISLAEGYGQVKTDPLGNVLVHRPGKGKKLLITAHMDTPGLVNTYVEENGFLRVGLVGNMPCHALVGQVVTFSDGSAGLVCAQEGTDPAKLTVDKLYVDPLGAKIPVGETAAVVAQPRYANGFVLAPGLNNRLGCAICLKALELLGETERDITCVFSAQGALGFRGIDAAAFTVQAEAAFVVETCLATDGPEAAEGHRISLTGGPVVEWMNGDVISHPALCRQLMDTAQKQGISVQAFAANEGKSAAGRLCAIAGGCPAVVMGVPVRQGDRAYAVAHLPTAMDCARLLAAAMEA